MILVAGMHRSGTSALARVLALAGCDLPKTLLGPKPDNVTGFWESQALTDLNEEILVSSGTSHLDWLPFDAGWYASPAAAGCRARAQALLRQEFGDSRLFVLKDPRVCRLLPFWLDVAEAAGVRPLVVLPVRNPLDVAASLTKRNQLDPFVAYLAWLRHVLDAEAGSRGLPRTCLRYEQLLTDARGCLDRIGRALGVSWPRGATAEMAADLDAFLAPDLQHHRSDDARLLSNPRIPPWVRTTFAIVDGWTRDGERKQDLPALDRLRTAFDDAAPAFSRALATSRQQMFHRMAERDAARRDVHERDQRIAALAAELDAARRTAAELGTKPGLHHCEHIVEAAERTARYGSTGDCLRQLRRLCVDEFALLLHAMPDKRYPGLSSLLPAMAPVDVQRQWTGATGMTLLKIRVAFIEKIRRHYSRVTGRPLEGARILDYGCGYGLMLRLMYYFTDPERIAGCDPWDLAIRHCKDARIGCRLDVTDYLPASLPYEDETFDLVLAYSVFTHTSRRASVAALEAISSVIRPDGLLVLTIRPREYWAYPTAETSEVQQSALLRAHDETGFAFRPHNRPPIDGDVTFGDTSMKVETIEELCPEWKVIGYDWSLPDLLQLIVLLQKRGAA